MITDYSPLNHKAMNNPEEELFDIDELPKGADWITGITITQGK